MRVFPESKAGYVWEKLSCSGTQIAVTFKIDNSEDTNEFVLKMSQLKPVEVC